MIKLLTDQTASGSRHDGGQPTTAAPARKAFAHPQTGPAPWVLALSVFAAVMGTSLSLHHVTADFGWLPQSAVVVALTLLLPALMRRYLPLSSFAPIGALLGWFCGLTLVFFPNTALLWFVPTLETVGAARELAGDAALLIMTGTAPVAPDPAIFFLICAGLGFVALLIDTVAITVAMPAASSLGLVLIMLPAALITAAGIGTVAFVAAAAGFLMVLGCCRWYAPEGKIISGNSHRAGGTLPRAMALGAAVVLLTATLPTVIPGFTVGAFPQGSRLNGPAGVAQLDPMISLGRNLRQQSEAVAVTYLTTADGPQYLRLNTLENFGGKIWLPEAQTADLTPGLSSLLPARPPADSVPAVETLTLISTPNLASEWLPAPLSATEVTGLRGRWLWNPETQTMRSSNANTAGQNYTVRSTMPALTRPDLAAARWEPRAELDPIFSALPADMPAIIATTAKEVAGNESSPYNQAIALQDYLRSGAFSYSLDAPVQEGYDGSGMDVLATFLNVKRGYCVHFSAAMAVLARELGIPSRIAVGYAPGSSTGLVGEVEGKSLKGYQATGRDAHAWTELYFHGLGWVPFEPTPSRGLVPDYAQEFSPVTPVPNNTPTVTATATPTVTPSATATATAVSADVGTSTAGHWALAAGVAFAMVPLLAVPALARVLVRRRRLRLIRGAKRGGARIAGDKPGLADSGRTAEILAWRELVATAVDHGYGYDPALTPARHAERISELLGPGHPAGLALLLRSYEQAVYGKAGPAARRGEELHAELGDAVETLIAQLQSSAPLWQRLRAILVPASLLRSWHRGHAASP